MVVVQPKDRVGVSGAALLDFNFRGVMFSGIDLLFLEHLRLRAAVGRSTTMAPPSPHVIPEETSRARTEVPKKGLKSSAFTSTTLILFLTQSYCASGVCECVSVWLCS